MESATRTHYREVLSHVAAKAKDKLPQAVNGRLESAVKLVLLDEVTVLGDGRIVVGSCSDTLKTYALEGDTCTCEDWQHGKAPGGWCKHRIAAGLHKRLHQVLDSETPPASHYHGTTLPEAPSSVNFRAMVGQFEMQFTLRDASEAVLLQRLEALLKHKDIRPIPKPAPRPQGQ